jgi:hypothetical protein
MHRYQTRLHLNYQRTLYSMLLLRAATVPNEPSPIFEHSGTGLPAERNQSPIPLIPAPKENEPC